MELAKEIKAARFKASLSQSQAAAAWDVPVHTLQNWEAGRNSPRGLALKHLRQILDAILNPQPQAPESHFSLSAAAADEPAKEANTAPPESSASGSTRSPAVPPLAPKSKPSPPKQKRTRLRRRPPGTR